MQHEYKEAMTTLENRLNTAFLVIDVQNGVVAAAHHRRGCREHGQPRREGAAAAGGVMWVQHSDEQLAKGSDEGRIVAELAPAANRDFARCIWPPAAALEVCRKLRTMATSEGTSPRDLPSSCR